MKHKQQKHRPPLDSPQAQLGERLAPGAWIDKAGALHVSIPEILDELGIPDTAENRAHCEELLREKLGADSQRFQSVPNRLPPVYPDGLPLYWMNEETGRMKRAVHAYLNSAVDHQPMEPQWRDLFKAYLIYVVECPCWKLDNRTELVAAIDNAQSTDDLSQILEDLLNYGIDPI
jgi:hypothetical protein